jgi:DNA-binding NtrC family response regulator
MAEVPSTEPLTGEMRPLPALKLVVVDGPDFGAELTLRPGSHRVGKAPENELVLTDPAVSRLHMWVHVLRHAVKLVDGGSKNGSFCDGRRFTEIEVGVGVRIKVGRTELELLPLGAVSASVPPSDKERFGSLVGQSVRMRQVFALLERAAAADVDVLIGGETGTGKERCAEALHAQSARRKGPFVVLDPTAISPQLFESELFGHVRGAFTGAGEPREGFLQRANHGTLFLDEVGELPLEVQPRLLRVLERREVKPVGGNAYRAVDVRVLAATHRNLEADCKAGRFREDLYHRLAVVRVELPPLRERKEDIPLLVRTFLGELGRDPGEMGAEVLELLKRYEWPGNLRQLKNVLVRAVSLGISAALPAASSPAASAAKVPPAPAGAPAPLRLDFKAAKEQLVSQFERQYLVDLMGRTDGHISRAAEEAGIDRAYLHRLLNKHGL